MGARVYLHIGLQKSGTTYLQHVLAERHHDLARAGLLYPLPSKGTKVPNHQVPFYGLLPESFPWISDEVAGRATKPWRSLRRTLDRADRPVLLSAEVLSYLGPHDVRRVVEELGDVEVLVTARGLDRLLTSSWQQNVRAGDGTPFEDFLRARALNRDVLAVGDVDTGFMAWRAFGLGSLVRRWSQVVGPAHVTVVTNGGRPAERLWHRFLEAVDVPGLAEIPAVELPAERTNVSLRWAQTEVLASVNRELAQTGADPRDAARVRQALIDGGFLKRPAEGPPVVLPAEWRAKVADWSADELAVLAELGTRVVGDLDDLQPNMPAAGPDEPPDAEDYRRAAEQALVAVALDGSAAPVRMSPRHAGRRAVEYVRNLAG